MRGEGGDGPTEPQGPPGRDLFERIIAQHGRAVKAAASCLCRSRADRADLVQETYEHALRKIGSLRDEDAGGAWLVTILKRCYFDRLRRDRTRLRVESSYEPPPPDEPSPWERVGGEDLRRAIEDLPERFRSVAILHDLDGLSNDEVARRLAIPYRTAATRLHRAHLRLKKLLRTLLLGRNEDDT